MITRLKMRTLACTMLAGMPVFALPAFAASSELQEVVVTAQRRSESTQKASITVNVLSANQLASISGLTDLTAVAPGVQVAQVGNFDSPYVRGVGTTVTDGRVVSPVPTNIDGVVVTEGAASAPFYFDLARVEVVKGPQGTLYGRNATGGAVNLITNDASFDKFGGNATVEVGNYALIHVTGAINVPLADRLALRGSFQVTNRHGYINDGSDDDKTQAGRLKLRYEPTDGVTLHVTGQYGNQGGKGAGVVLNSLSGESNPWTSNNSIIVAYPPYYTTGNPGSDFSQERKLTNKISSIAAQLDWDLGPAKLTLLPAYSHQDFLEITDATNFRFYEQEGNVQSSVEARLANETKLLKWVIGGYFYNFHQYLTQGLQQCILPGCNDGQIFDQTNRSYAGFGQATLSVTDRLRLIGGARYTTETISGAITPFVAANPPLLPIPSSLVPTPYTPVSSNAFNWKLGAEYDVAPRSMVYFTASTGFKAGGVDTITTGVLPYRPETLTAYDLGWKNRLFDNKVQLNLEAFDWEYKNQQFGRLTLDPSGVPDFLTANAQAATVRGVDVDATWKFTPADQLHFDAEYAHGVYDKFIYSETSFGGPPVAAAACPTTQIDPVDYSVNCSGKTMPRLPTFSGSVGYRHDFAFASGGLVSFDGALTFATQRLLGIDYTANEVAKGYTTGNITLTYTPPVGGWSVSVWARNLANSAIYTAAQYIDANTVTSSIAPPRTYGIRVEDSF